MTVKIYWNGIKINGDKLIRCGYSLHDDHVSIYARDYADLPRNLLPVENDSDSYTDYFEEDHAQITPEHPLYKYFVYAAMKAQARLDRPYCEKLHATLASGKPEPWPGHYDSLRDDLARREKFLAEFDTTPDPGQPTAADLEKIDQQRQKRENDAREAAQLEQQRMQEEALIKRVEGEKLIKAQMEAHPIKDGEPTVLIHWSEHPAFYGWKDDELIMSVAAADRILGTLDMQEYVKHKGYDKTKFSIMGTDPDGEPINYTGRYDLGDGERGLIKHIHNFGAWYLTHDESGHTLSEPLETNGTVEFAAWLKQFTA